MVSRRYLPHPCGFEELVRTPSVQTMTWRARRDACRSDAEIAAMSPARRERAIAARAMAHAMLADPGAASPRGLLWATRIVMRVPPEDGDWAERHRTRERERWRRRKAEGDPKLPQEIARGRAWAQTEEGREAQRAARAARAERERRALHAAALAEAARADEIARGEETVRRLRRLAASLEGMTTPAG